MRCDAAHRQVLVRVTLRDSSVTRHLARSFTVPGCERIGVPSHLHTSVSDQPGGEPLRS